MDKHIVLIGMNYGHFQGTGDKNFWYHLIPLLAGEMHRISVISLRKHDVPFETESINNCRIDIHYLPPVFLETPDGNYSRSRIFWKKGVFPAWLGAIEKKMSISRISDKLGSIHAKQPFSNIHLMDNFGLGNRTIKAKGALLNAGVSISAMSFQGKSALWYHPYLKLSYDIPGLSVVAYSSTLKKKLIEICKNQNKIIHIPWGATPPEPNPLSSHGNNALAKKQLSLSPDRPLFLWAGFIQQIQKRDFLFALRQAQSAVLKGLNATFFFAFKPESYDESLRGFHQPGRGMHVLPTGIEQFNRLKSAADIFYSPLTNKNCILAPPLTWIETMAAGVPILTTNVPGADEIVEDSKTGFIAKNEDDLIDKMFQLAKSFPAMREKCVEKINHDYNILYSAGKYLDLWFNKREA